MSDYHYLPITPTYSPPDGHEPPLPSFPLDALVPPEAQPPQPRPAVRTETDPVVLAALKSRREGGRIAEHAAEQLALIDEIKRHVLPLEVGLSRLLAQAQAIRHRAMDLAGT